MTPLPQRTTRLAKDLLDVAAVPKGEVEGLLTLAAALKKKQRRGIAHALLKGKTLGLLFKSRQRGREYRLKRDASVGRPCAGPADGRHPVVARRKRVADTARVLSAILTGSSSAL